MSSHAPGPWARDYFRQIVDGNGQIVYVDNFTFGSRSTDETKANTKRIIACVYVMAMGADDPEEATCLAIVRAAANMVGQDEPAPLKINLPLNSFEDDWDASGMDAYDDL